MVSGNYLGTVVQTVQILNAQNYFVDVYALLNYDFLASEDLKRSVARSKKLFVILDMQKDEKIEMMIKAPFVAQKDLKINFFYPDYENITAYIDEYRIDQARFDQVGLMERILLA
ncbi:MAG: hypothetical protein GXP45_06065 [bacterium]|nr:hypothetical protein [bacterium]